MIASRLGLLAHGTKQEGRVELATKMSADLTNLFFEENPDACIVASDRYQVCLWNRGAEAVFGYTETEALHRDLFELIVPAVGIEKHREEFQRCSTSGPGVFEWLAHRKDGAPVYIDLSIKSIINDGALFYGVTAKDVTLLKVARDAKLVDARFRGLFESVPDAIVVANETGRIVLINRQAEAMFGYRCDEICGKPLEMLMPERFRQRHIRHRSDYAMQPRSRAMGAGLELYGLRKDQSEVPVEISLSPLTTEEGLFVVSAVRDITERKLQNRRIEEANRLKSEFLASMSHELRTPLNGIIGFTEFLIDQKPGPLNERQREYLQDVLDSGQHLLQLINDVLDLSKIEAGKMEMFAEHFSVDKAIGEVCAAVEPLAQKKQIQITRKADPRLDQVMLDPAKFKQVLYNLLSNAIKFTDAGGKVDIFAQAGQPGYFELRVQDNGIGIQQEDLSKLFVEFGQLNSGAERRRQGTGLGLALTKKIVEAQRGSITVESEYGKGSTFTVVLPVEAET